MAILIMWKIIVLSMIPGIILIIQNGIYLSTSLELLAGKYTMKSNVQYSLEVGKIIHSLQIERGVMSLFSSSGGDTSLTSRLNKAFASTDQAINSISKWTVNLTHDIGGNQTERFARKATFHEYVIAFRERKTNLTHNDVLDMYGSNNQVFIRWMVDAVKDDRNNDYWAEIVAYHMLINGKECVGIERAIGTDFFLHGFINKPKLLRYKGRRETGIAFLSNFRRYSTNAETLLARYLDLELESEIDVMRANILNNFTEKHSLADAIRWVDNMTAYINQLDRIKISMASLITQHTENDIGLYQVDVIVDIIVLVVTMVISASVSFLIYKLSKRTENVKGKLHEKTKHLEKEQRRTESLLSQLVPVKIAKRMEDVIAEPEYFTSVTVMFADICRFDDFVRDNTPRDVMDVVNDVFDVFEKRVDRFNVTKLGTTGNIMLVAAGLYKGCCQGQALEIAKFALDLQDSVCQIQTKYTDKVRLQIGISSGPVVAGVLIGRLARYCVFGETVNTAKSMMESCPPQQIHLTEDTYSQLASHKYLLINERTDSANNTIPGVPKTYFLRGNLNETVTQIELDVSTSELV